MAAIFLLISAKSMIIDIIILSELIIDQVNSTKTTGICVYLNSFSCQSRDKHICVILI